MRKQYDNGRRIIKRFLFIPRYIGTEMRWFEISQIEQRLKYTNSGKLFWVDVGWINLK